MALELTGRVSTILEPETGESRSGQTWIKQTFTIIHGEEYEREVAFVLFGEQKVGLLKGVRQGDTVRVNFSISSARGRSASTENKFFSEVSAYKIANLSAEHRGEFTQSVAPAVSVVPAVSVSAATAPKPAPKPAPKAPKSIEAEPNDLPESSSFLNDDDDDLDIGF
jgi:hypothetical protein